MTTPRFEELDANISVTKPGAPGNQTKWWLLECTQRVPTPVDELFPFFADAYNLQELTPSYLGFEVLTPKPIAMKSGALIDYKLRVRGIPLRWRTEIEIWDPPHRFVDQQLRGPYARWHHTHTFEPTPEGGTLCTDRVEYRPKGWILAPLINAVAVQRDVVSIFKYRTVEIAKRFGYVSKDAPASATTPVPAA